MILKTKLFGKSYQFRSIKEVLGKANEERSGDKLVGICAETVAERVAAKQVLSHLTIADLRNNPVVPYEEDEVTRVIQDGVNGFLIPPGDTDALERKLRILLSDREKADEMGRNAARLLEEYLPEHVDREWMDYLISRQKKK